MEIAVAGCPFVVGPDEALTPLERARLLALARVASSPAFRVTPFRLSLVDEAPWPGADASLYPDHAAASVRAEGERLRITHRRYLAQIDVEALEGRLQRTDAEDGSIEIALRVALAARLPSLGGLPLHAAGLVVEERGFVFFGPSGAGKSTLSALAPGPVLSDELVAVTLLPPTLRATGFWGELDGAAPAPAAVPLAALVELARGPAFRLERLAPRLALRRLLGVIMVPPLPRLWSAAMALAAEAAKAVPVFRMEWTPEEPPWDRLRVALAAP